MPHEPAAKPRFLDELRQAALQRFGRPNAPERIVESTRRFIVFHDKRHPRELGATEIHRFFGHVARSEKDPLRCLENCHEAMTFLYGDFLRINVGACESPNRCAPKYATSAGWSVSFGFTECGIRTRWAGRDRTCLPECHWRAGGVSPPVSG